MSRWTYYSPLWLGVLLVLALNESLRAVVGTWTPAAQWGFIAGVAVVVALQCQVLMTGAQGAFAQVLPVPFGRSIRGRGAALAGWLLIAWVSLSGVTALLSYEAVGVAANAVGILALAALAGFAVAYIWNWPVAVRDFASSD